MCRKCAKLNYKSQQQTKDSMVDYWNGMNYVKKYLNLPPWPSEIWSQTLSGCPSVTDSEVNRRFAIM